MEPTEEDLASPEFNAIWEVIKPWDIERKYGDGYAEANGTDVMTILSAVRPVIREQIAQDFDQRAGMRDPDNSFLSRHYSIWATNAADRVRHPEIYSGAAQGVKEE